MSFETNLTVAHSFAQSLFNLLPSLCIWLAYLLPAHSMAGLYAYSAGSDTGIYLYMGKQRAH